MWNSLYQFYSEHPFYVGIVTGSLFMLLFDWIRVCMDYPKDTGKDRSLDDLETSVHELRLRVAELKNLVAKSHYERGGEMIDSD